MLSFLVSGRNTLLAVTAGLLACGPSTQTTACLTRADCAPTEECVAGGCLAAHTDSGPMRDGGEPLPEDGGTERDAPEDDAMTPDDAAVLREDAAGPRRGETCADPIRLALGADGTVSAEGELAGYLPSHPTFCADDLGPEVIYLITLPDGLVDVELRTRGDSDTDTIVAMSETCAGTGEFYSCHDDRAPEEHDTRMILHRYPSSPDLYVMVRGYDAAEIGHYTLDVAVTPVADTSDCSTTLDLTGGAYVVAWASTTDEAPHPSCLPDAPQVSDVYRMRRDGETTVDSLYAYLGSTQGAISDVDGCTAPITESWCAPSTMTSDYWELGTGSLTLHAPEIGYFVVSALAGSRSYSFSVYP